MQRLRRQTSLLGQVSFWNQAYRQAAAFGSALVQSSRHVYTSTLIIGEESHAKYCHGGYHPVQLDEIFNQKYQIVSKLGHGTYSTVWLTRDLSSQGSHYLALKILTADSFGTSKQPAFELEILQRLKECRGTHPGSNHVVHLVDNFMHEGPHGKHLCLALDLMGPSVSDLQRNAAARQLSQRTCQQIATHTLQALDWLHDTCQVVHTDLKWDNILTELPNATESVEQHLTRLDQDNVDGLARLRSQPVSSGLDLTSELPSVRLTDFGVASWRERHLTEWIQPPSLRAPEVFIRAPWDASIDVWSFACLIYELLQGRVLFRGKAGPPGTWTAEEDQLAQMMELFGPLPTSLLTQGKTTEKYFDNKGQPLHIKQLYPCSIEQLFAQTKNSSMSAHDYEKFEAFLLAMLEYEPSQRKTADGLLKMPWLDVRRQVS